MLVNEVVIIQSSSFSGFRQTVVVSLDKQNVWEPRGSECKWLAVRGWRWSILTMKVIYFHFFARQGVVCNSLYSCGSRCVCDLLHQCYPYFKVTLLLTLVIIQFTVTDMRTSPHLWQLLIPRCVSWTWNVRYFQSSSIGLPLYSLPHV